MDFLRAQMAFDTLQACAGQIESHVPTITTSFIRQLCNHFIISSKEDTYMWQAPTFVMNSERSCYSQLKKHGKL